MSIFTDKEIAISAKAVHKSFKLPHDQTSGIKQLLVNGIKRRKGYETQHVIKGMSFDIHKGEFFGIVGRNGSGKSTLLKLLAGIYEPDSGNMHINGTLIPFIELGVGFNPELTGRENVYLNGALLGFSKSEVDAMYDDIVSFAELGRFMDQRLKNYSSGMQVRLAFSIAIKAQSDILLLDEVLAVGDEAFQKKCFDYFARIKREGVTVILVTHDMSIVQRFCTRAMLIDKGQIVDIGDSQSVSLQYSALFAAEDAEKRKSDNQSKLDTSHITDERLSLSSIQVVQEGKEQLTVKAKQDFTLKLEIDALDDFNDAVLGVNLINSHGNIMLATSTRITSDTVEIKKGVNKFEFDIENIYTDDTYSINVAVVDATQNEKLIYQTTDVYRFDIKGIPFSKHSLTHPNINVRISRS